MIHYINIANNADAEHSMQNKVLISKRVFCSKQIKVFSILH